MVSGQLSTTLRAPTPQNLICFSLLAWKGLEQELARSANDLLMVTQQAVQSVNVIKSLRDTGPTISTPRKGYYNIGPITYNGLPWLVC